MAATRLALWLLTRAHVTGLRDALVGDLLEEIERGRSTSWVCRQLIGFYGHAVLASARRNVRMTQPLVVLALGAILLGGAWLVSIESVVETWASVYYIAGTVSLFAHVMSRTTTSSRLLFTQEADRG
jgi:hypothetical protein